MQHAVRPHKLQLVIYFVVFSFAYVAYIITPWFIHRYLATGMINALKYKIVFRARRRHLWR